MRAAFRRMLAATPLLMAAVAPAWAATAPAGTVVYAYGEVSATGASGDRALRRGDSVYSGETLETRSGRVQVRFTDGGFAALQPDTRYAIAQYAYGGEGDAGSRSFFDLVKGGVRFVSGAIGKINRDNYRIRTAVATIGIRGSAGRVWTDGRSMEAVCHKDGLFAEQNGRRTDFDAGQGVSCTGSQCNLVETGSTAESGDTQTRGVDGEEGQEQYTQGDEFLAVGGGASTLVGGVVSGISAPFFSGGNGFVEAQTFPGDADDAHFIALNGDGQPFAGIDAGDDAEEIGFSTVDPDALANLPDPALVQGIQALLAIVDPALLEEVRTDPAELVEFEQVGDFIWGAFANGHVLRVDGFLDPVHGLVADAFTQRLEGHQAWRFFYGERPAVEPGGVFAGTYTQFAEFHASNASGTATGIVRDGTFDYVFGLNHGELQFGVALDNGRSYQMLAFVAPDPTRGFPFLIGSGSAAGGPGSPGCTPSCGGFVAGSFIGGDVTLNGNTLPGFAGFSFSIFEQEGRGPDWVGGILGLEATSTHVPVPP